jgi:hypothetical protein
MVRRDHRPGDDMYPVTFDADYEERRSRLSVLFRLILLFPLYIWIFLYGIVAQLAVLFAWVAIIFTGRFPDGLYRFVAGFIRVVSLTGAYSALLTDRYPPFLPEPDPGYPVRMEFAQLPVYSRVKTFFRAIIAIPIYVMRYVLNLLLEVCAIAAWVVIVITGRLPRGLFDTLYLVMAYVARSDAYLFLLTETYPPFQVESRA